MAHSLLKAETGHINLSPTAFRLAARDYFKCFLDFEPPGRFSVVPFFLCCRAIELALKAYHLETLSQAEVKSMYNHDIEKLFNSLPSGTPGLSAAELLLLQQANAIYKEKAFEYMVVHDAATGFSRFPDIDELAALARKLTDYDNFIARVRP